MLENNKIGIIGLGNMGAALFSKLSIEFYYDPVKESNCKNEIELAEKSDIIILAVKPNIYDSILEKLRPYIINKLIILIAPGYTIKRAKNIVGENSNIIRLMPNTPVSIGEGVVGICFDGFNDGEVKKYLNSEFSKAGAVINITENEFDVFGVIAGCMPAIVFEIIEALSDGAVLKGFNRKKSYEVIAKAIAGSCELLVQSGKHPAQLKDEVSSPGGTTIQTLSVLEDYSLRSALIQAVKSGVEKSQNM